MSRYKGSNSSAKGRSMDSKKPSRRKFLSEGAAVAGLVAGAVQSASGQAPAPAPANSSAPSPDALAKAAAEKRLKDQIAYGERSHFVTSLREPADGRPSPDAFGLTF